MDVAEQGELDESWSSAELMCGGRGAGDGWNNVVSRLDSTPNKGIGGTHLVNADEALVSFDDSCGEVDWSDIEVSDSDSEENHVACLLKELTLDSESLNVGQPVQVAKLGEHESIPIAKEARSNPFRERRDINHFPPWEEVFAVIRRPDEPSSGNGFTNAGELDLSIETLSILNTREYVDGTACTNEKKNARRRRSLNGNDDQACVDYERYARGSGGIAARGVWCSPRPSTAVSKRAGKVLEQMDSITFLSTPNQDKKSLRKGQRQSSRRKSGGRTAKMLLNGDEENGCWKVSNQHGRGDSDNGDVVDVDSALCMADFFQSASSQVVSHPLPVSMILSPANKPKVFKPPCTPPQVKFNSDKIL